MRLSWKFFHNYIFFEIKNIFIHITSTVLPQQFPHCGILLDKNISKIALSTLFTVHTIIRKKLILSTNYPHYPHSNKVIHNLWKTCG